MVAKGSITNQYTKSGIIIKLKDEVSHDYNDLGTRDFFFSFVISNLLCWSAKKYGTRTGARPKTGVHAGVTS